MQIISIRNFLLFFAFALILILGYSAKAENIAMNSSVASKITPDLISKYSQHKYWLALLHYHNHQSTIKDPSFFLSIENQKKLNPELELEETIKAFFSKDNLDDSHAICKYPARFKWIKSVFELPDNLFPKPRCKKFEEYIHNLAPNAAYIAFASENLKNPTSMMGHPFIKIEGQRGKQKVEHAVTYFGDYGNENILKFYAKSITSGVRGTFFVEPYAEKLNFYNDVQKRSIWEFKIDLSQNQIDDLVLHIWEFYRIDVKYHFIFHNCVTALVDLLKIAGIENMDDHIFYTPIEMVADMMEQGYVHDLAIYPSYDYEFRMIYPNLQTSDKDKIKAIIKSEKNFSLQTNSNNSQSEANILYASKIALKALSLNETSHKEEFSSKINQINQALEKLPHHNLKYETKNPLSHDKTSQITLGYGQENNENVTRLGFYPAYNNLTNNNSQYFNEFALQMLNFEAKYYHKSGKFRLDNFDILKIQSILDSNNVIGGWSSGLRINFERKNNLINTTALYPNFETNIGKAKYIFSDKILAYMLASPSFAYYNNRANPYIYLEPGFFIRGMKNFKIHGKYRKYFSTHDYKYQELWSLEPIFFIKKNHNLILELARIKGDFDSSKRVFLKYQYSF